ncbi:aminoglycoside phosphotransferase family protein [Vreelandella rituensis]|uniref:Aminoglycoside phosphotransferase family protein n=1 Tax=Vreelandella rituensis TaxID=2282306 RepID=A0A368U8S0_9GAMM|nr:aminoglycoside phosphotransferase family protein [Halomonas rituensis]RCV92827.1 aminoglycoside phosphotransferase family protein [Halomonas rituensis]
MPTLSETRLNALAAELHQAGIAFHHLDPMPDTGLAHDHIWISREGADWVARLPKQSQMNLLPQANLDYQAACYQRTSQGGHTPHFHGMLAPSELLPRGALLVEAIDGRLARLPEDLALIAEALASLHSLPLPPQAQRMPLLAPADPWSAMRDEVEVQARWLESAGLPREVIRAIQAELAALPKQLEQASPSLISFDTHPGNFLVTPDNRAILVDLEKCRYGLPGIDLAHTSLYTSTTWDITNRAILDSEQVLAFYRCWQAAMPESASAETLMACRRATWLWSLTWCAKWRASHLETRDARQRGEDWSSELSDDNLITHVRDRVDHYLSQEAIIHVQNEFEQLKGTL